MPKLSPFPTVLTPCSRGLSLTKELVTTKISSHLSGHSIPPQSICTSIVDLTLQPEVPIMKDVKGLLSNNPMQK